MVVRMQENDIPLIAKAITDVNVDYLRLSFACKSLRKILSTGDEKVILRVLNNHEEVCPRLI